MSLVLVLRFLDQQHQDGIPWDLDINAEAPTQTFLMRICIFNKTPK